jgi:DNA-directed RNA polymerase I subunit RPA2
MSKRVSRRHSGLKHSGNKCPSYAEGFVNDATRQRLRHLVAPHVDGYSYFLDTGINEAIEDMLPLEIKLDDNLYVKFVVSSLQISNPSNKNMANDIVLTPREARERCISYAGSMILNIDTIVTSGSNAEELRLACRLGELPIMVMSSKCNLAGLHASQLVGYGEEANEMGGYFIVNGIERVIRLLQIPRRNHAMAVERSSYKNRGPSYTDKGVSMRCVRADQSSITLTLHYLENGSANLRFVLRKQEFLLPVILIMKSLCNISDKEIFDRVLQGNTLNTFTSIRMELLLRDFKQYNLKSQSQCLAYLGVLFRMYLPITDRVSDVEAGKLLIKRYFFVHLKDNESKLECLLHMLRKLFSFVQVSYL